MTEWETWAQGVLQGIGAPLDSTNIDTLWAWSNAESGADVMRWNNPLNTTLAMFSTGNVVANQVGVKIYPTVGVGIRATILTLENGHYPVILANLRGSVARAQWGNACPNLGTWGTGCGWLQSVYGSAPGNLTGGTDLTQEEHDWLHALVGVFGGVSQNQMFDLISVFGGMGVNSMAALRDQVTQLQTEVSALKVAAAPTKIEGTITGTLS